MGEWQWKLPDLVHAELVTRQEKRDAAREKKNKARAELDALAVSRSMAGVAFDCEWEPGPSGRLVVRAQGEAIAWFDPRDGSQYCLETRDNSIFVDPADLQRVVIELFANAIEAVAKRRQRAA